MPAALCPAGEFPATTTLPRYAAGREDMVAVLLLSCGQAGQFLELTNNANRSSTRLLQDYFGSCPRPAAHQKARRFEDDP